MLRFVGVQLVTLLRAALAVVSAAFFLALAGMAGRFRVSVADGSFRFRRRTLLGGTFPLGPVAFGILVPAIHPFRQIVGAHFILRDFAAVALAAGTGASCFARRIEF